MVRMEQAYHKERPKIPPRLSVVDLFNHNQTFEALKKDITKFREALFPPPPSPPVRVESRK
jgi:hypothetical protein